MKLRWLVACGYLVVALGLLQGCASVPTGPATPAPAIAPFELERLPQVTIPNAARSEVKSLAMGAARSRGWIISDSAENRLVTRRPLDANSLSSLPPDLPSSAVRPGTRLEVTSYFTEQSGGVKVATKAELVTPSLGEGGTTREDYTDTFRASLMRSLESLRKAWSEHRHRIARATPPDEGWKDPWGSEATATEPVAGGDLAAAVTADEPLRATRAEPPESPVPSRHSSVTGSRPDFAPPPPSSPEPRERTPAALPTPQPGQRITQRLPPPRPLPEPRRRPPAAAPVLDAGTAIDARPPSGTMTLNELRVPPEENMMQLPTARTPVGGTVTWAAYAEQYARRRGCRVTERGSELIETRRDGEVHMVRCAGSDSFLVICQNGVCKGLL